MNGLHNNALYNPVKFQIVFYYLLYGHKTLSAFCILSVLCKFHSNAIFWRFDHLEYRFETLYDSRVYIGIIQF